MYSPFKFNCITLSFVVFKSDLYLLPKLGFLLPDFVCGVSPSVVFTKLKPHVLNCVIQYFSVSHFD